MRESTRRPLAAIWTLTLALCACAPFEALPDRQIDAPECGYIEAREVRQQAQQAYENNQRAGVAQSRLRESRRAMEAAERREHDAEACEQRVRDWSDLSAQWQSARAAVSMQDTARTQAFLTFVEIFALFATISVGVWGVMETRRISRREINALNDEALRVAARFEEERAEAHLRAEEERARYAEDRRAWLVFEQFRVSDIQNKDRFQFSFEVTARNLGEGPALDIGITAQAYLLFGKHSLNINAEHEQMREKARESPVFLQQRILFPKQATGTRLHMTIQDSEIREAYPGQDDNFRIVLGVIGVARYRSRYDEHVRTTSFSVNLCRAKVAGVQSLPYGPGAPALENDDVSIIEAFDGNFAD